MNSNKKNECKLYTVIAEKPKNNDDQMGTVKIKTIYVGMMATFSFENGKRIYSNENIPNVNEKFLFWNYSKILNMDKVSTRISL